MNNVIKSNLFETLKDRQYYIDLACERLELMMIKDALRFTEQELVCIGREFDAEIVNEVMGKVAPFNQQGVTEL